MDYVRTDENGKTGHLQIRTSSSCLMASMGVLNRFIYELTPEGDLSNVKGETKLIKNISAAFCHPFAQSSPTGASFLPQKPPHIHIVLP